MSSRQLIVAMHMQHLQIPILIRPAVCLADNVMDLQMIAVSKCQAAPTTLTLLPTQQTCHAAGGDPSRLQSLAPVQ